MVGCVHLYLFVSFLYASFRLFYNNVPHFSIFSYVFFHYRPTVDWEDMKIEHYCVKGIWHLVLSLIIVFALLLVYRIVVVLNSYYKQFRKHARYPNITVITIWFGSNQIIYFSAVISKAWDFRARRLYGMYIVYFLKFMILCNSELVSFF